MASAWDTFGSGSDTDQPVSQPLAQDKPQQGSSAWDTFGTSAPSDSAPPAPPAPPVGDDEADQSSFLERAPAAIRAVARDALPVIGTAVGGGLGAAAGAGLGAAGGPLAFVSGVAGAAAGGIAGAKIAQSTQDFLINELGLDKVDSAWNPFSTAQTQRDVQEHPGAVTYGDLAAQAVGFTVDPEATLAQRVSMGAAGAGGDIATQWQQKGRENIDPWEAIGAGAFGAAFPTSRFGNFPSRFMAGRPNVEATPEQAQVKAMTDRAQDVTPVAPGVAHENTKVQENLLPPEEGQSSPGLATKASGAQNMLKDAIKTQAPQATSGFYTPDVMEAMKNVVQPETQTPVQQRLKSLVRPQQPEEAPQPAPVAPVEPQPASGFEKGADRPAQGVLTPREPVTEPVTNKLKSLIQPAQPEAPVAQKPALPKVAVDGLKSLREMGVVDRPDGSQVDARVIADALEKQNIPPGALAAKVSKALHSLQSATGEAMGPAKPRIPFKRPMVEGMQANDAGVAAKRQAALDATRQTYAEFGPDKVTLDPNNPTQIKDIAKQATARAAELNDGVHPLDAYNKTINPPPEVNWLRKARSLDRTGGKKMVDEFLAAHALKGETGKNIEGELANKPQREVEAPGAAQEAQGDRIMTDFGPRPDFPDLGPETQNGKRVWSRLVQEHNDLRGWLRGLPDEDYDKMQAQHGVRIGTEVNTTHDPASLKSELLQDLAEAKDTGTRTVAPFAKFEYPAEGGVEKTINKASDLSSLKSLITGNKKTVVEGQTPEGAKSEKWQDLLTPEELAEYNKHQGVLKAETPEDVAKAADLHEADGDVQQRAGNIKSVADRLKAFAKSESGAGPPMFQGLGKMLGWTMPLRGNPNANPAAKVAMDEVNKRLTRMASAMDAEQTNVFNLTKAIPAVDIKTPGGWLKNDFRRIYRAMYDRTTDQLAPRDKDLVDNTLEPMRQYDERLGQELWELKQKNPDLKVNAQEYKDGVEKTSMPRLVEGLQSWERDPQSSPFTTERHFPSSAQSEEDRSYYSLIDNKGQRFVGRQDPEDKKLATIFGVKHQANINSGKFNVGEKIKINGKTYTVDHASPEEIMNAGVKWEKGPNAGQPITYIEDPSLALSQSIMQKRALIEATKFLRDTMASPEFKASTTTDKEVAKTNGWVDNTGKPIELPEFIKQNGKTLYGDKRVSWPMMDYLREGFKDGSPDAVRKFGSEMIQSLFAIQPIYHDLNVATNWATSRGFDWLPMTGGYRSLAQTMPKALQVAIEHGDEYRSYKAMGAPLNYGGTVSTDVLPNLAKRVGQGSGFLNNPSKLDPIARIFGMSTPELYRTMKVNSNKITWFLSDAMTLQKIMENENLHGMSRQQAIDEANRIIPNYERMPTIMGQRIPALALQDPALSLFGKYLWGNIHSLAGMVNRVATGTPAQRTEAIGQLMVAGIILSVVGPAMDRGLQALTGNPQASIRRFGLTTLPYAISRIGKEGLAPIAGQFARESVPVQMLTSLMGNEANKRPVLQPGAGFGEGASEIGGWAANQIPAVQQTWSAIHGAHGDAAGTAGRFLGEQVGVNVPSPESTRFKNKQDYKNMRDLKARRRNPANAFEAVYQQLMGQ